MCASHKYIFSCNKNYSLQALRVNRVIDNANEGWSAMGFINIQSSHRVQWKRLYWHILILTFKFNSNPDENHLFYFLMNETAK